ncbi:UNVERIFIED_CONTAM: Adenine phosphoribosyltransferase 5 [Sesamum radiatum]|uniref:adenine phosphoribosyltransferase n=1 Tax=Sesamum radiatum TaxID=300843 RepID=A0AAW2VKN7_SESRA
MFAAENGLRGDPRLKGISEAIRVVPNFPKPGIMFQDITAVVSNHKAFKDIVDIFVDRYRDMGISVVAGEVISELYELEYGNDCLEMHLGAVERGERALVIDDIVATGGTLSAAIRLLGTAQAGWETTIHLGGTSSRKFLYLISSMLDWVGVHYEGAMQ